MIDVDQLHPLGQRREGRLETGMIAARPAVQQEGRRPLSHAGAVRHEARPLAIQVPDDVLSDLRDRLSRVRWPDEVPGSGWAYGTDLAYLQQLVAYWRDGYDWRANEARLNAFQHFTVPIADIDLHFIHQP